MKLLLLYRGADRHLNAFQKTTSQQKTEHPQKNKKQTHNPSASSVKSG